MKKVFYFLNTVLEWVDVVEKLKLEKDWTPELWATSEILQPLIEKKLKETYVLDLQSHRRGEFKDFKFYHTNIVLDKKLINDYAECEKNVIPMMNRMDPSRHNFAYHQRIQLYYKTLIFWEDMFERLKPDLVVFDETPHVPFEYIMGQVALKKGVKLIRFSNTHINNRLLLFGNINETPSYIERKYKYLQENIDQDFTLSKDIENYYTKLAGTYKEAIPYYMLKEKVSILKRVQKYFFIFKRTLNNITDSSYYRTEDGYFQDFKSIKIIKIYYRLKGYFYKNKLLKIYNKLTNNIDLSQNYIYVPLHFQPERTSSPDGDIYENQWLMIQLLAQTLPKGWKLYVKEHISQFRKDFSGQMGRHLEFYSDTLEFENVELVPLSESSFDLIDSAKATATISGTVALESVVRNKRAMIFGYPWFEICEGVSQIKNSEDSKSFFKNTIETPLNQKNVKIFFKLLEEYSVEGNHSGCVEIDKNNNIENLINLIQKYEEKI